MMKRKWMLAGAVMLLAAALAAGLLGSRAAPAPGYLLRYAENQPDDYPTTQSAYYFADLVSERTGGDVKITVYANGTLGDESSVIRQVQFGGIDLARVSIAQLVVHAEIMSVLTMPYLYRDNAHMWSVLEGSTGDRFLAEIAPAGLIGLSWYDAGERHFYTRTPITGLDDLRGMTIRVQEADYMSDMVRALGALPRSIPYSEVYSSLSTGAVDGAENNWPSYEATQHYRAAPYMLLDGHVRIPEMQILSAETAAALPDEYVEIIRECARESALYERQLWAEREQESRQKCLSRGVTETALSDAERERFRAACQPIYEKYAADYLDLIAEIQASGE